MDFSDEQNALLEIKIDQMQRGRAIQPELYSLDPNAEALEELRLLEILPVALKKKEPEFPQLLEIRTRKNFHKKPPGLQDPAKPRPDDRIEEQEEHVVEGLREGEKQHLDHLKGVFNFMTENKYVVEAIFENVLLENRLFKFPLSELTETEKKQLMEKLLMNEEFKEYIYQKILREQEANDKEGREKDLLHKNRHLMSDAITQDELPQDDGQARLRALQDSRVSALNN